MYVPNPTGWVDPLGLAAKPGDCPKKGVVKDSVFAQVPAKPTKKFSEEGQDKYSKLAGQQIETVADLTEALKQGRIQPSEVPLDSVVIDRKNVITNTRASTALIDANIPKSQWFGANKTGLIEYDDVTFNDLAQNQLNKCYGGSVHNARK